MRWNGQELGVDQQGTLPGLARLNNLVRSVQTPEFAGVTFHEVLAKSALNKVPGQSYVPFGWTINPYRGCSHACVYCLDPSTSITMADGSVRALRKVEVGDVVVGTAREGQCRRYTRSKVLAKWSTRKPAYRITLADGTALVASGDHRFLTDRGWKYVTDLEVGDHSMGWGAGAPAHLVGAMVKMHADLRVVAVEPLGTDIEMLDITTSTEDFIANGVVSHNCFARPTHEYLDLNAGEDFDRELIVKVNVGEVLQRELARPSWRHEPVALGTNTDPYQRAEGRYALMPGIIDALASSGTPFSILTKGTLLRRDLPLLRAAGEHVPVDLAMSIAVYDDELQRSIEPGTPTTTARLATVTAVREAGFDCSVFLMPILPFLTDTRAHLDDAIGRAKAAGATSVVYSALHLRGSVKPWFLEWLEREHPELVGRYRAMYPGASAYAPKEYRAWLAERIRPLLRSHRLDRGREDVVTGGVASSASPTRRARPGGARARAAGADRESAGASAAGDHDLGDVDLAAASPSMLF
ncbi:MAG TPA: Rv2578c family radical SAM protein [Agromyces sp.]